MLNQEKNYKVALMGPSSVGKTSLVLRLSKNTFSEESQPTIGAAFVLREMKTPSGPIVLSIWDTAGQERFKSLVPKYARGSSAIVVVFDLTDNSSLAQAQSMLDNEQDNYEPDVLWYLVGNKKDGQITYSLTNVEEYCKERGIKFMQTSAKTGEGVIEVFQDISDQLTNVKVTEVDEVNIAIPIKKKKKNCC